MFAYLKGTLKSALPQKAVLEVQGIGYELWISLSTFERLPPLGKLLQLFTSLIVREDSQKLYGFTTLEEKNFFEILIEVSGVGPRLAIALLGHMSPSELLGAISQDNTKAICQVPGIGKKMAQRLTLELSDKLKKTGTTSSSPSPSSPPSGLTQDATSALIHLGYNPLQAQRAITKALTSFEKEPPLAELITYALKVQAE